MLANAYPVTQAPVSVFEHFSRCLFSRVAMMWPWSPCLVICAPGSTKDRPPGDCGSFKDLRGELGSPMDRWLLGDRLSQGECPELALAKMVLW